MLSSFVKIIKSKSTEERRQVDSVSLWGGCANVSRRRLHNGILVLFNKIMRKWYGSSHCGPAATELRAGMLLSVSCKRLLILPRAKKAHFRKLWAFKTHSRPSRKEAWLWYMAMIWYIYIYIFAFGRKKGSSSTDFAATSSEGCSTDSYPLVKRNPAKLEAHQLTCLKLNGDLL